jgi:hypothetical protein
VSWSRSGFPVPLLSVIIVLINDPVDRALVGAAVAPGWCCGSCPRGLAGTAALVVASIAPPRVSHVFVKVVSPGVVVFTKVAKSLRQAELEVQ